MITSVASCAVTKRTSLSRQIGRTGFWTAPRRVSATMTTIVSSVVGSCHDTTVPSPTPRCASAAAQAQRGVPQLRAGQAATDSRRRGRPGRGALGRGLDQAPVRLHRGLLESPARQQQSPFGEDVAHHFRAATRHRVGTRPQPAFSQPLFGLLVHLMVRHAATTIAASSAP